MRLNKEQKDDRMKFARKVVNHPRKLLKIPKTSWDDVRYMDGAGFYIARSHKQQLDKFVTSLGPWVWRSRGEGLEESCVGPTAYAKSQGEKVMVWGILHKAREGAGRLSIKVIREKQWNQVTYGELVNSFIKNTAHGRSKPSRKHIIQDNERVLWTPYIKEQLKKQKLIPVKIPRYSPDLNPVEVCWDYLRKEMNRSPPPVLESRREYVRRLHDSVRKVNRGRADDMWNLLQSMPNRAQEVIRLKGKRTKY